MKKEIRTKWWALYDLLADLVQIPGGRGPLNLGPRRVDPALFFPLLGVCLADRVLLLGERGTGKSTLARIICALVGGLPVDFLDIAQLRVNPELTLEMMIAAPDLAELNQGRLKVLWSVFAKCPYKIVDELFRLPPGKASIFLQGLDTGTWSYLSSHLRTGLVPVVATGNYADAGSYEAIPPLLDRFSIGVELGYRGPRHALRVAQGDPLEARARGYGLNERFDEAVAAASQPGEEAVNALRVLGEKVKRERAQKGLPVLYEPELVALREVVHAMPLTPEAQGYGVFLFSLLAACSKRGMKRSVEPCPQTCQFFETPCSWVQNGASVRAFQAIIRYGQALAWLIDEEKLSARCMTLAAPYAIWHRTTFNPALADKLQDERSSPWNLYVAQLFASKVFEIYQAEGAMAQELSLSKLNGLGLKLGEVKNPVFLDLLLEESREREG